MARHPARLDLIDRQVTGATRGRRSWPGTCPTLGRRARGDNLSSAGRRPAGRVAGGQLARSTAAAKPKAALELVVIPSLKKLVFAAGELPKLETMTSEAWQTRVKTLAMEAKTRADGEGSNAAGQQ